MPVLDLLAARRVRDGHLFFSELLAAADIDVGEAFAVEGLPGSVAPAS